MTDLNESAQIDIDAPASVIFAILTDASQHARIDAVVEEEPPLDRRFDKHVAI